MGYLNILSANLSQLVQSFSSQLARIPCFKIITVEPKNIDTVNKQMGMEMEPGSNRAAGSDLYRIVTENKLTDKVLLFKSILRDGDIVHLQKTIAPPGFFPYGDKCFRQESLYNFLDYVKTELREDAKKESEILQRLCITLRHVANGKPAHLVNTYIRMFALVFQGSGVDVNLMEFLLSDGLLREQKQQGQLLHQFQAKLKAKYAVAEALLRANVMNAVSGDRKWAMSIWTPTDRLILAPSRIVTGFWDHGTYKSATLERSGIPMGPVLAAMPQDTTQQCLRQWIRSMYSDAFGVTRTADEIIYMVLLHSVMIQSAASVPAVIKHSYKIWASVMLGKAKNWTTEKEWIRGGNRPPSSMLEKVVARLALRSPPNWSEIFKFSDRADVNLETRNLEVITVPETALYTYECMITLADTSKSGGYLIDSHGGCGPTAVFSEEGKKQLRNCPICFFPDMKFTAVPPEIPYQIPSDFWTRSVPKPWGASFGPSKAAAKAAEPAKPLSSHNRKLVILRGVLGSGKTTTAKLIQKKVESRGGLCVIEGLDKYSKNMSVAEAMQTVRTMLESAVHLQGADVVVVIDTCGDRKNSKPFSVDFRGWKTVEVWPNLNRKLFREYLQWSYRNVLVRGAPGPTDDYVIHPGSAPNLHEIQQKKTVALFGSKAWVPTRSTTKNDVAAGAKHYADAWVIETDLSSI